MNMFLVLALSFVTGVIGDPPKDNNPGGSSELSDQCNRKEFIDEAAVIGLQQITPGMDKQYVLQVLGNAVTKAIKLCLKESIPFDNIEIISTPSYICGSSGKINNPVSFNVKSWTYLGGEGSNEPIEFTISFRYEAGVNVEFYKSYVKIPMAHDVSGSFYYNWQGYTIDLTVSTDPFPTLLEKVKKKQCFLHVKNFEASFTRVHYTLDEVDHSPMIMNKKRIKDLLKTKVDYIKDLIPIKLKAAFYEALVNSGEWVCLDDEVKEIIDKKLTSTVKLIKSDNFKKYCVDYDLKPPQ